MPPKPAPETTDASTDTAPVLTRTVPAAWSAPDPLTLTLGEPITVTVAEGVVLHNSETGQAFVPGEPTTQTVTPTTLRRLMDGDLKQVAPATV